MDGLQERNDYIDAWVFLGCGIFFLLLLLLIIGIWESYGVLDCMHAWKSKGLQGGFWEIFGVGFMIDAFCF